MIFGSVCSGIEAASVAWHPLGWRAAFFAEIEKFPRAVLAHHYPEVPNRGDMTMFKEWPDAAIDVLVGGTPCQSFSVAGLRKGMADPRGNLALVYLAMADRFRPRWLVWENVPGVLSSSGGRDFGAFLGGLGELGYGFAYRVLDAQYYGVAQRRRRVFVVGYLGDWRRAAAVLFERESLCGNPPPRREAREGIACAATSGTLRSRHDFNTTEDAIGGSLIPIAFGGNNTEGEIDVATACNAHGGRQDFESETFLVEAATPFDTTQLTNPNNRSNPQPGDPCHALSANAHAPAIAFSCKDHAADAADDVAPTLRAMAHSESHANGGGQLAVAVWSGDNATADPISASEASTYTHEGKGNFRLHNVVQTGWRVRRLTPRECERLQGFPDDYTLLPGKTADGPRYKALGNSMAVPVMRWIGERIAAVDKLP